MPGYVYLLIGLGLGAFLVATVLALAVVIGTDSKRREANQS